MISALLLAAEGLAQLGCGIGAGIATIGAGLGIGKIGGSAMDASWAAVSVQVLQQLVQVWVLVRLVVAPWTLSLVSQRLLVRFRPT